MIEEELEKEAEDYAREWLYHVKDLELHHKEDDKPKYIRIKEAYLAGAEPREKQIAELSKHIVELQEDKGELIDRCRELEETNAVLERRIERSKECMKKLLFIINSDPANYNYKGLVRDAEDFIYNRTCNIRQLGQHCISETRCIMCDK